jgi:hypothetical protein
MAVVLNTFELELPEKDRAPSRPAPDWSDAVEFARRRLGFTPDDEQAAVLRSQAKRGILNCARQWGKSMMSATKALHRVFTRARSLVLMASPTERQSAEFLGKVKDLLPPLNIAPRGDGHHRISLLLPNGSRIVGLPGTEATVRGFSAVSMLLIDEAARVEDRLFHALRPMLAIGDGDIWLLSTPCGRRGFFYETWEFGGNDWARFSVRGPDCKRISRRFLEEMREAMGPRGSGRSICAISWISMRERSIGI